MNLHARGFIVVGPASLEAGCLDHATDMIAETGSEVRHVYDLNFGQCQLALQAPVRSGIKKPSVCP